LLIDELEELYCDAASSEEEEEEEDKKSSWYSVYALTKGASKVELVTDLNRERALFIIQELERWLKIGAPGAGHEVRS
jgi:hypothetical protein